MNPADLFLFLLFTGGKIFSLGQQDNQNKTNQSFVEIPGGNSSGLVPQDEQKMYNGSFLERMGRNISASEQQDNQNEMSAEKMSGEIDSDSSFDYDDQPFSGDMSENSSEIFYETFAFDVVREAEVVNDYKCSFMAILEHLNLTEKNEELTLTRPVKHYKNHTWLLLDVKIYAILDVREIDQSFVSYIWVYLRWDNEHIWWNKTNFCGLDHILVPKKLLWMPDLTIEEMTEQDKSSPSPYLNIRSYGWVEYRNDQVVISTCRMHVYKFPFDTQSCNISFKSIMHSDEELLLLYNQNNTMITEQTRETMRTQSEWLFVNLKVTNKTVEQFGFNQTMIIYTIKMKRRSLLYIVNFLLPILFFLCLDLASLLMSDSAGEKVGFKITVLLAVTVMQLILNEILPCSSDKIPLIALYCIGIFGLMLISLLETVLVIYLLNKDSASQNKEKNTYQSLDEDKKSNLPSCFRVMKKVSHCTSVNELLVDETPSVAKEGGSSQMTEVSVTLEKISDELEEMKKTMALLSSKKEDDKPGYWTRVAQRINAVFTVFYVITVIVFLAMIFILWNQTENA